jgi:tRNA G10  N-methylase Trm11
MMTAITGDCREVLKNNKDGYFTAIVTDPPCGMGEGWNPIQFLKQYDLLRLLHPKGVSIILTNPRHGYFFIYNHVSTYHDCPSLETITEHGVRNVRPILAMVALVQLAAMTFVGNGGTGRMRVLDPFCGSGTILLAAQRLGITAFGVDIDPACTLMTKLRLL